MAFMKSGVIDFDGKAILASCPFYQDNPLCVNSCACFVPMIDEGPQGKTVKDFNLGYCGLTSGEHVLAAVSLEEEENIRHHSVRRVSY